MKGQIIFILIAIAALSLWNHRTKNFTHDKFLHYPTQTINFDDQQLTNFAKKGAFHHQVSLTFTQKIQRKRINNYLFILDNQVKLEVALIDLTYISLINVNYFSGEHTFSFEREIMFSLPEDFNDRSFEYSKNGEQFTFSFNSKQILENNITKVVSNFNIHESKNQNVFKLQLEHIQPSNRCVTYLRNGIVSYKCYGGQGSGRYEISIKNQESQGQKQQNFYRQSRNFDSASSTAAFDGFRASGWLWQWVWGMGSGVSDDGRHISINFGTVRGIAQDVIHIDDKIIPIVWIDYSINQNITVGNSFQFKSIKPQMELTFKITAKQHNYRDMLIFKNDMIKFQGYWSGYFIDPDTNQKIDVKQLAGLVQTADSIF